MSKATALLLSGGMDSSALCAWRRPAVAMFVSYGQVCEAAERHAATQVCRELGVPLEIVSLQGIGLGSGDLAGLPALDIAPASDWWPYRNQLLVSAVASRVLSLGLKQIVIGTVLSDASHADGTARFIEAMSCLLELQEGGLTLEAPAINMSSVELIRCSGIQCPTLCWAHSCHRGDFACGTCRGCNKHREVMAGLGYEPY